MKAIKETSEAIIAVTMIIDGLKKSLKDGKFSWTEYRYFIDAIMAIPTAVEGSAKIPKELRELDDQEAEEIKGVFKSHFDISDDNTEEEIEKLFNSFLDIYRSFKYLLDKKKLTE